MAIIRKVASPFAYLAIGYGRSRGMVKKPRTSISLAPFIARTAGAA
jgi:hypothetical protein